ncbi:uncharacterized protein LOC107981044 [Nasonia vitripennis]|uniref:Secreted protein n=1 Tax=Nasonia vitripennis TaxID=7425 RepID=A0A7M7IT50_NASVI|nr:uncharacterized protein LOC107981044 [Nasonia vitripennis]
MIFKALFFVLVGATLVLGKPVFRNLETATKKEARDIIEIDETNNQGPGIVVPEPQPDTDDQNELPSGGFSTVPPTAEPTVGEEELPEDLTARPTATFEPPVGEEELPEDNAGEKEETVHDKVEKWIGGVEEKVKEHFEGKKEIVKDTWDSLKGAWNRWHLF